jgi:hypothetical protein
VLLLDPQWRQSVYGLGMERGATPSTLQALSGLLLGLGERVSAMTTHGLDLASSDDGLRFGALEDSSRLQRPPHAEATLLRTNNERGTDSTAIEMTVNDPVQGRITTFRAMIPPAVEPVFQWIQAQQAAFTVNEIQAMFPELGADTLAEVFRACAKGGLLKALRTNAADLGYPAPGRLDL